MKRIAKEMAVYFNDHFSNADGVTWNIRSAGLLYDYTPDLDREKERSRA